MKIPLIEFAETITYQLTPSAERVSPLLWTTLTTFNRVHRIWRWYQRIELYRNPNNFAELLAGHLLEYTMGNHVIVRIAAQCVLISSRILDCIEQQSHLHQAGERWLQAIKGHFPKRHKHHWKSSPFNPSTLYFCSSPSSHSQFKSQLKMLKDLIKRIMNATAEVFFHFFKLSLCLMDAIEAFYYTPYTRYEGVTESFINTMKTLEAISENQEKLLAGLNSNREIIERVLDKSLISYDQLYQGVAQTEALYQQANKIAHFSNGILQELGKRILGGSMIMVGLSKYQPIYSS